MKKIGFGKKIMMIASAFIVLNIVFHGMVITFNGVPFGSIALIFGIGFASGLFIKK